MLGDISCDKTSSSGVWGHLNITTKAQGKFNVHYTAHPDSGVTGITRRGLDTESRLRCEASRLTQEADVIIIISSSLSWAHLSWAASPRPCPPRCPGRGSSWLAWWPGGGTWGSPDPGSSEAVNTGGVWGRVIQTWLGTAGIIKSWYSIELVLLK